MTAAESHEVKTLRQLADRLRNFTRGESKLEWGDELAAADALDELLDKGAAVRAREAALDEAEAAIAIALENLAARYHEPRDADEVVDFLLVEFGLRHPKGAHHRPPGFASVVNALPE